MTARAFDDSDRCHGCHSGITGDLRPICITCSRLTSKRNTATVKGQVYRDTMGSSDCKDWKQHALTVRLLTEADKSAVYGGGGLSINTAAGLGA